METKTYDEGFTLIEMMVVLFIIMILSGAVYFTISGNQDPAVEIKAHWKCTVLI